MPRDDLGVSTPPSSGSSLFTSKMRAPATPEHYIRRSRLLELVDDAVRAPLTVVAAPAGSGKTALLSGWVAERAGPTAWLSLDETDRDPVQLWTGLIAAVDTLVPDCSEQALRLLRRPGALLDAVSTLLGDLDCAGRPLGVLIVDNVHLVDEDDMVAASLEQFLRHLPSCLHVVLVSRRRPRLPVDRLRARGLLAEVHFAELKFSPGEARALLSRLAPSLEADRVEAAASHAAGWAAGLQLAALAARSARALDGLEGPPGEDDLLVSDYVMHEVLADEARELVDVLLDVSVVDWLNSSLARALTGREDAGELLMRAEERGLFVTRLGTVGWFDMHALVRSTLVAELARRSPSHCAELHARAARWFEEADEVPLALEHWLLAGRPRDSLRLLAARSAQLYDSGREATIARTIANIPPGVAAADVEAMVEFAWCHVLLDRRRFVEMVGELTWWASAANGLDETVRGRLSVLRSIAATMNGDWAAGAELARRALSELGENWSRDPLGRFGWSMIARDVALSERWDDSSGEVREAELALSQDRERRLAFEGTRALGEALAGRPVDTLRVAAGVRHSAGVTNMTILRGELSIAEALAHRELGDRPRATAELVTLVEANVEPVPYCRILAALELAQVRLDEGELDEARLAFDQAEELVEGDSPGPGGREWLARVGTLLALSEGDIGQARRWADQDRDPFWGGVSAARVTLAEGNRAAALAALDAAVPRCPRHDVVRELLRARALETYEEATKCVIAALDRATSVGLLQTVASEVVEMPDLVEHAAWRLPKPWLERLRRASVRGRKGGLPAQHELAELLTDRERDVLRFLPSRLTLREIAAELHVSVNTLKFHLKVIYRKVGVRSRTEAAEIARAMTSPGGRAAVTPRAPWPADGRTPPSTADLGGTGRRAP